MIIRYIEHDLPCRALVRVLDDYRVDVIFIELHFTIRFRDARRLSVGVGEIMMEDTILRFKAHGPFQAYDCGERVSLIELQLPESAVRFCALRV